MNHRDKVIHAIRNRLASINRRRELEKELSRAQTRERNASLELARQIKNVVGRDKHVLHDGWIYTVSSDDLLTVRESDVTILSDSH